MTPEQRQRRIAEIYGRAHVPPAAPVSAPTDGGNGDTGGTGKGEPPHDPECLLPPEFLRPDYREPAIPQARAQSS